MYDMYVILGPFAVYPTFDSTRIQRWVACNLEIFWSFFPLLDLAPFAFSCRLVSSMERKISVDSPDSFDIQTSKSYTSNVVCQTSEEG